MATRVADVSETPLIRYSRWALAVTAACMPLYVVRYRIGPVPTTLLEDLILVTIALYAAGRFQARHWHVQRTSLEIPIAFFYVAVDLLRTPQQFRVLLLAFAIGATIFALMNLGAWAIALGRHQVIATGDAPEALYSSPNAVAMFLEPPFALAAGFALYTDDR